MEKEEARILFRKLKIKTLLDLALILPATYEDKRLSRELVPGREHILEVKVVSNRNINDKFYATLYLPAFNCNIEAIFFKATPYHLKTFSVGSKLVVSGRVNLFKANLQLIQPKKISQYGVIVPKYRLKVIKESQIRALIEKYITKPRLLKEGLKEYEANLLLKLHYPNRYGYLKELDSNSIKILKFIESFNHIKKLRSKREYYPAMDRLDNDPGDFIASLPFELTSDQWRAISDIRRDLLRVDRASRRIIIGDVGSGKTMVILASAVMAKGKGAILMVPTSILCKQIYEEALKYLPKDMKVALVMQGKVEGDYKSADFIIGTHALLYLDDLPKVPLVMVDEQHRFGTNQRALLEAIVSKGEKRPHYLQFSATPIPRTQAMMESEMIDVSLIEHTPFEKLIHTKIVTKRDFPRLLGHIEMEIKNNHQVLIVYPLVESSQEVPYQSIDEARGFWESRYKGVYVTHGKDKNKEKILEEFRDRGSILLATTVIEVGISLPRLTTIIIVGAERLGLATLHQLRGRVGRNGLESVCFLYTNNPDSNRLKEFAKTTNGFEIARLDLKYRASGDILDGTIQSGQKFKWLDLSEDDEIIKEAKRRVDILESNKLN